MKTKYRVFSKSTPLSTRPEHTSHQEPVTKFTGTAGPPAQISSLISRDLVL